MKKDDGKRKKQEGEKMKRRMGLFPRIGMGSSHEERETLMKREKKKEEE